MSTQSVVLAEKTKPEPNKEEVKKVANLAPVISFEKQKGYHSNGDTKKWNRVPTGNGLLF